MSPLVFIFLGIDTAKNAADHLDIHLLDALNQMLAQQSDKTLNNGEPVRSSQLDLAQLRAAIKQTYFELDKDLKAMVKDESGCVCVGRNTSKRAKTNTFFSIFRSRV
jgi:hypothetical protein